LLSIGVSLLAFVIVVRAARSTFGAVLAATILILSKAFVDYSTSGLENPLTHLCLVSFLAVYLAADGKSRSLGVLSTLAGLGILNRMDTALLFVPALGVAFLQAPRFKNFLIMSIGFLPFLLWEFFSLFYYGFPFPNTAYAKLGTCYGMLSLIQQGGYYLLNSLGVDPITCAAIATGLIAACANKERRSLATGIGIVLYLFYVVKVGGDFMSGRFLAAPLAASVMLIAQAEFAHSRWSRSLVYLSFVGLGMLAPLPTIFCGANYGVNAPAIADERTHGIGDERGAYFQYANLLNALYHSNTICHPWAYQGREARERQIDVIVKGNIGFFGFYAGPHVHIIDPGALTDPLLARLPAVEMKNWRVGHFVRMIPDGYVPSLRRGEPLVDKKLASFNEKLSRVTQGPLLDIDRLREIWNLNLGRYDHLIDIKYYQSPPRTMKRLAEVRQATDIDRPLYVSPNGLEIQFDEQIVPPVLELSLSSSEWYEVLYLRSDEIVAHRTIIPSSPPPPVGRLAVYTVRPPSDAAQKRGDRVRIVPLPWLNDGSCQLGYLRLRP
jgi:arabinofuranosyltransferase